MHSIVRILSTMRLQRSFRIIMKCSMDSTEKILKNLRIVISKKKILKIIRKFRLQSKSALTRKQRLCLYLKRKDPLQTKKPAKFLFRLLNKNFLLHQNNKLKNKQRQQNSKALS